MTKPVEFDITEKLKIQLIEQGVCPKTFDDTEMPTDLHFVEYSVGDVLIHDAVRAYSKVDIFDAYYDKLKDIGKIHSINSGFGRIKPKLFGKIK